MLDYYSDFPGPSKPEAILQVQNYLEPILKAENPNIVDIMTLEEVRMLIAKSVASAVEEVYHGDVCPGSASGWITFVKPKVISVSKRIFQQNILTITMSIDITTSP